MKTFAGHCLVVVLSACVVAGCVVPPLSIAADGGGDGDATGGATGQGGFTGGGLGGAGGGMCTVVGAAGASAGDAGAGCPPVPASMLTVSYDFASSDMGVTMDPPGGSAWTGSDGCPFSGAVQATFTFNPTSKSAVRIGTQVNPAMNLTNQVLYARVKVVSGRPGLIQLVAKTGVCSVYSDGDLVSVTAGDGWKVLSLDPKCTFYVDTDCHDPHSCASVDCATPGNEVYDPSRVTEVDVQVNAPTPFNTDPVTVLIDTIAYGH